jgi:hypothetical protein
MKNRYVLLFFGIIASITLVNLSLGAEVNESDIKSLINMILNPEKPDFISASNILWFDDYCNDVDFCICDRHSKRITDGSNRYFRNIWRISGWKCARTTTTARLHRSA